MRTETPTPVENRTEAVPTVYVVIGIVVLIVLGIALAAGILFLASNYSAELEAVRDVFIIALALESCVFGVVLMLMLIMLIRLVNTVEFEIKPILEQTNETIGTVRGTTNSYVVGIRQGLRSLFGDPRKNLPD
jgi:tellurite resistance protein TehA-like permease